MTEIIDFKSGKRSGGGEPPSPPTEGFSEEALSYMRSAMSKIESGKVGGVILLHLDSDYKANPPFIATTEEKYIHKLSSLLEEVNRIMKEYSLSEMAFDVGDEE